MFVVTIDTAGAAFEGDAAPAEVARILRVIADRAEEEGGPWTRPIFDINGARCGHIAWETHGD